MGSSISITYLMLTFISLAGIPFPDVIMAVTRPWQFLISVSVILFLFVVVAVWTIEEVQLTSQPAVVGQPCQFRLNIVASKGPLDIVIVFGDDSDVVSLQYSEEEVETEGDDGALTSSFMHIFGNQGRFMTMVNVTDGISWKTDSVEVVVQESVVVNEVNVTLVASSKLVSVLDEIVVTAIFSPTLKPEIVPSVVWDFGDGTGSLWTTVLR